MEGLAATLRLAVRASLHLPSSERPAFIAQRLLADEQAGGEEAARTGGVLEGEALAAMQAELKELGTLLTRVLNETHDHEGWPRKALAVALLQLAPAAPAAVPPEAAELPAAEPPAAPAPASAPAAAPTAAGTTDGHTKMWSLLKRSGAASPFADGESGASVAVANPMSEAARAAAAAAFAKYDADGSGSIDKSELFAAMLDLGQVLPVNGTEAEKNAFLERSFVKADADGNGVVDAVEFANFFSATTVAYAAFAKYDADGSGSIDREELFAVMLDLGQVTLTLTHP